MVLVIINILYFVFLFFNIKLRNLFQGNLNNRGLSTNNCRIENVTTSKLFSEPLTKGKRCIVICEGFYEWKTTEGVGKRKPYFIHMPQKNGVSIEFK